jgi:hypothetical protein
MSFKTDTTVVHLIQISILVSVDNEQEIFVSYNNNLSSRKDTNKLLNVTIPDKTQICGSKPIPQSFTELRFEYQYRWIIYRKFCLIL